MKLSVIIVNYNVKYFLQQCLTSVFKALKNVEGEVWVVDNNSVDGSVEMVKKEFPEVKLIANKENVGFSRANNQAIRKSSGEYVLLLNPDTIVEEATFEKVVAFMDEHPKAGGLGVKMIDGKGHFLPESKRGIPTPEVAFYKMAGLTKLFPKSKRFAKYYLGHLDKNKTHKVEILSGAFMLLRKSVLDKIGLLDETFFMYGEDIDLSYRILQAGYDNYYFADTTIVHYKGESTKKGSLNYVFVFYNAMIIFAQKHFAQKNAKIFMLLIKLAIFFRAGLSILRRIIKAVYLPVLDASLIFAGFYFFVPIWEKIPLHSAQDYPDFIWIMLPIYIFIWIISAYYSGSYDNPVKLKNVLSGILAGTAIILIFYALIDVKYRFSRALILFGAGYAIIVMTGIRIILHSLNKFSGLSIYSKRKRKILIIGEISEAKRVKNIIEQVSANTDIVGFLNPEETETSDEYLGNISQIDEIIKIFKINEIIFCAKNLATEHIISMMLRLSEKNVSVKIAPQDSISIIGSNSINTPGSIYTLDFNSITTPNNRRLKNLIDKSFAIIFLLFSPVIFLFVKEKIGFFKNIFLVLIGKKSWVGFYESKNFSGKPPTIKKCILTPIDSIKTDKKLSETIILSLNISYAKNYQIENDIFIILKNIKNLGRQ